MIILGSTGSIGVNTLEIAKKYNLNIEVLVAGKNIDLLNRQIKEFNPKIVVIKNKKDLNKVKHNKVLFSEEGILEAINLADSKIVVNALVGFSGVKPSIESIKLNKKLALANKESLVVAGKFLDTSNIIPIDSEHFGLKYLISDKKIESMLITASGGAFRDYKIKDLKNVTIKEALNHPNWKMGKKITIDSATMVNKLFEILEAYYLFKCKNIDAIIETNSLIHAIINFKDGSSTAHFATANMQLPIAYAILEKVEEQIIKPVDFFKLDKLEFKEIKTDKYPIWEIKDFMLENRDLGVVLNCANDVMVDRFLNSKCSFLDISKTILKTVDKFKDISLNSIDDIFKIDKEIKNYLKLGE